MPDLVDVLTTPAPVNWITATIDSVNGNQVTLSYLGGLVPGVAVLDSYTPVPGDAVHCLSRPRQGILVLGTANAVGGTPPDWTPGAASIITPSRYGEWDGAWDVTSAELLSGPGNAATWHYRSADMLPWGTARVAAMEIELTRTPGDTGNGAPELFLHENATPTGTLVLDLGHSIVGPPVPVNGAAWVRVPVSWAQEMATGPAFGIGIGLGVHTNSWTAAASGRLRITPV